VSRPQALVLDIIEGFNIGAVIDADAIMTLEAGGLRIGADEANDIVLADHDMADQHALIERTPKGEVFLTALAPGVRLGSRSVVVGERTRWKAVLPLAIGSARISRRPLPPAPASPRARALAVMLAAGTAGALVAGTFYFGSGTKDAATAIASVASQPAVSTANAQLLSQTNALLKQQGLATYVTLSADNDAVVARGSIPDTLSAQWASLQTAFDDLSGSQVVLVNKVTVGTRQAEPPLKIGGVSMYPIPYLITTGGQRLTEGAMLAGGWEILSITTKEIVMGNGQQTSHIPL
jgi:hypothetical protein